MPPLWERFKSLTYTGRVAAMLAEASEREALPSRRPEVDSRLKVRVSRRLRPGRRRRRPARPGSDQCRVVVAQGAGLNLVDRYGAQQPDP